MIKDVGLKVHDSTYESKLLRRVSLTIFTVYTTSQIIKGLQKPRLAAMEINRRFSNQILSKFRPPNNIFDEDWDNLLILDGCRYDLFAEYDIPDSSLEYRWSGGSHSKEFLSHNLRERELRDTVWITANPFVSEYRDSVFKVIDSWKHDWDDKLNTVPPKSLYDTALEIQNSHPNKRIVVHFMQPHYPFIGETGQSELPDHRTFTGGGVIKETETEDIWTLLRHGEVDSDLVWKAYKENLEVVLPIALELANKIPGKSVVTADHGNAFGEIGFPVPIRNYGHKRGLRYKCLVKVPWIEVKSKERKNITKGDITSEHDEEDEEMAKERLQNLGYI